MRWLMLAAIRAYRRRPARFKTGCCPYTPTCSAYGLRAIEIHGARAGLALTLDRLSHCAPGRMKDDLHDPVPLKGPSA
jgi:putative membrane protein insertion efficiency factor